VKTKWPRVLTFGDACKYLGKKESEFLELLKQNIISCLVISENSTSRRGIVYLRGTFVGSTIYKAISERDQKFGFSGYDCLKVDRHKKMSFTKLSDSKEKIFQRNSFSSINFFELELRHFKDHEKRQESRSITKLSERELRKYVKSLLDKDIFQKVQNTNIEYNLVSRKFIIDSKEESQQMTQFVIDVFKVFLRVHKGDAVINFPEAGETVNCDENGYICFSKVATLISNKNRDFDKVNKHSIKFNKFMKNYKALKESLFESREGEKPAIYYRLRCK